MTNENDPTLADAPRAVAAVYEDGKIAGSYLEKRMQFSWQRLLHREQVSVLNVALQKHRPRRVLEIAPGPARLSVELHGISAGVMVENSEEMIAIAANRLQAAGLAARWSVLHGNAFELTGVVPAGTFDFAYTMRFIRHFREPERRQLYTQLRDCLAPRGLLMFDVVNGEVRERIEARHGARSSAEIAIYDASYDAAHLAEEMRVNGFEVLALYPVLRHFTLQSFLSYKLDDIVPGLVAPTIAALERLPSRAPLEWVALCRKA